jgi:DNA-binding PadR family transcriptional regulator
MYAAELVAETFLVAIDAGAYVSLHDASILMLPRSDSHTRIGDHRRRTTSTRSVEYAILGLVSCRDGIHGYRLKREFDARFGDFWALTYGQTYRALDRLQRRGLIAATEVPQVGRPPRRVFRITGVGRKSLDAWLELPARDGLHAGLATSFAVVEPSRASIVALVPRRRSARSAAPPVDVRSVFQREGEYWTIDFDGHTVRLRDTLGLRYLALLLAHPGHELAAVELVAPQHARAGSGPSGHVASCPALTDIGPALDGRAKLAYRARLDSLRDDLAEAERLNDLGRAMRAREELDAVASELARAMGLRGRDRPTLSPAERARVHVRKRIRLALQKIAGVHPSLGRHLGATVRTGTFCAYVPDPRLPTTWQT